MRGNALKQQEMNIINQLYLSKNYLGLIIQISFNYMEDISIIPEWDMQEALKQVKENPLDQKMLKSNLDKIYMITGYNQPQYLSDVVQTYSWLRLASSLPNLSPMLATERLEKYFLEDYVHTSIRYMILCRKFKLKQMMALTQQMMVEALKIFVKYFDQLQKYPKMVSILKQTFDIQKQFYKLNYTNEFPYLVIPPTDKEVSDIDDFIDNLKAGDRVDVLKTEMHSKRICWLPGVVKKISSINVYVICDNQKLSNPFDRKSMQVWPAESKKQFYDWRFQLKEKDKIDYFNESSNWVHAEVNEIRQVEDQQESTFKSFELRVGQQSWVSISDARIQKFQSIIKRPEPEFFHDDFNDVLFDPDMKCFCLSRSEATKSLFFLQLLSFAHKDLNLFELISSSIQEKKFKIQIIADLISFVYVVQPLFHHTFAIDYLKKTTDATLEYINNSKESTIRNFSKEKFEAVFTAINEFLKRLIPSKQRKQITENLQLSLVLRFLFSDFLDRKLQAVALITHFFKMSKHRMFEKNLKEFVEWVKENKIIPAIFNEKSHTQLISRSSDFMRYYLDTNPSSEDLQPLLIWNEATIKLVSESFQDFPEDFQEEMVKRVKAKKNVTNEDALNIIKKTINCQKWLLQNGGQSWVEVVKQKSKKKADIVEVFKQPFNVVYKITAQVHGISETRFRNEYFVYLNDIHYICEVLGMQDLSLQKKIDFSVMALDHSSKVSDQTFDSILPYSVSIDKSLNKNYQEFFLTLLNKLTTKQVKKLFQAKFGEQNQLVTLLNIDLEMFKKCFLMINEEHRNIDRKIKFEYPTPHSYKKEKRETLIINKNPNELVGMKSLLFIVFQNKNIDVTMNSIEFIGFLFNHLREDLKSFVTEFKRNFLENCLKQLYKVAEEDAEGTSPEDKAHLEEKYLKIIDQILSQSEKEGVDMQTSVNGLFPFQKLQIRLIDHFNVNKVRILMQVPSNWTLYELKHHIGKNINAYVHEMKINMKGKELDNRLNGHVIHTIQFDGDLVIQKRIQIPRVPLTQVDGSLVEKAKIIFKNIFKDYSQFGLMSKKQCQKYHQKCVGEMTTMGEARVEKIYDNYDKDKDGYLTEEDFLNFYENSAKTKESAVWSNLQTFGIRNDLEILEDMEITYPQKQTLTRYLLYNNPKFMKILFELLGSQFKSLARTSWNLIARLPLYLQFLQEVNFEKEYLVRYWLYVVEEKKEYSKISKQVLKKILSMSMETACMGLKLAQSCKQFDEEIFEVIIHNLKEINSKEDLNFHNKVILDNSLKILDICLANDDTIKNHFIEKQEDYCKILREGIMSTNQITRTLYCNSLQDIIQESIQNNFAIFEVLFNLVYKIFDNGDKSTLNIEYFDLFSSILEILRVHPDLMPKLKLNWLILTKSMIKLYMEHECTENSINSKADQVAQGLLRIISRLLNQQTVNEIIPLVFFIFQKSLFPENGKNKLKNAKSRQDAYELIYQICKYKDEKGVSPGLHQLFEAGFKQIYKKMSQKKASQSFSYYYYSYNDPRSQLGYAGLRNLGCICYMISMVQQLYMTSPFRHLILMADDGQPECLVKKGNKQIDDNIFHQFKLMFANLLLTEKQQYNPDEFCFSFKDFEGLPVNVSIQQDAQQFLNIFFDKMQTSLKNTPFKRIFEDIFGGKSCSQITCSGCGAAKERQQTFYPLSLQIKGYKNIQESFQKYIQGEEISDFQCDSCNNKCDVVKRNFLDKTPNYFIVHLQRMCFNYDKFQNQKVNSRWEFPQNLNVYDYTLSKEKGIKEDNGEFTYSLKGVVLHYGTADFGHYFSYIKESDNLWIQFNDERVREFDPSDIEVECFGGEHWRRQSQSAYLLVYEREKKSNINLVFKNEEQKALALNQFKLSPAIVEKEPQTKTQESILSKELMEKEQEKENEEKKEEQKFVQVQLDMNKIPLFVPQNIKQKINKVNDQFSFTINLSNDEFALFIYHVLSIDPPEVLKNEYLQLCYECFHLKQQIVDEENTINLSEWASKRFKEIIGGHGWQFLKNFGKNWESDILSIDRSTRTVIKSLLECVISDIMKSNKLNEEFEQVEIEKDEDEFKNKKQIVFEFLEKLSSMMMDEVSKHWPRFKEYFELWIQLVKENSFVRRYCEEKMMIEKILQFIMEDSYPYAQKNKRHTMGNQYYSPDFEYPLEFMYTLQTHGYELNDMEKNCLKAYAFMDKIIGFRIEGAKMIQNLCKGQRILSEKLGYLLLYNCNKVSQSDQVKPIIASIHEFLSIDDEIKESRLKWILGSARFIEHEKYNSYGSYGIHPETQHIIQYFSPLASVPILQQVVKYKTKAPHVAALLVSMLLQLEHDGQINNLDELPSVFALEDHYTTWFENFIIKYYNDTHKPYSSKHYVEYGNRIRMLWEQRPNRPLLEPYPRYLIGKTVEFKKVSEETACEFITVIQSDIKAHLLPLSEDTKCLTNKNIKAYKTSDNFVNKNLPKPISTYGHSSFMMHDRINSSDEEENQDEKIEENIFEKSVEGWILRKIILINESNDNIRLVIRFEGQNSNLHLPQDLISCEIRTGSGTNFTFIKKDVEKEVGEVKLSVKILGKATKSGYWPRQIITQVNQKVEDDKQSSDEDETTQDWV